MRGGQTQRRALVQADGARRAQMGPDVADGLGQEGAPRAHVGLGVADVRLDEGLIA